jgi:hypothetical protein
MSMQRWKPGMPVTHGEPLHHVDTSKDDAAGLVVFGWLLASVAGFLVFCAAIAWAILH